jgi:hypothetical protein
MQATLEDRATATVGDALSTLSCPAPRRHDQRAGQRFRDDLQAPATGTRMAVLHADACGDPGA